MSKEKVTVEERIEAAKEAEKLAKERKKTEAKIEKADE